MTAGTAAPDAPATPAQDPYLSLPAVAAFTLTSTDVSDDTPTPMTQVSGIMGAGGDDRSPQLSWHGFPTATRSFAVNLHTHTLARARIVALYEQ